MTLSLQQEKFAQALASGMQVGEAYRQAYHTARLKDETVQAKALALAEDARLQARVAQLKGLCTTQPTNAEAACEVPAASALEKAEGDVPFDSQRLWTREQAVRILVSIAMMEDGKSAVQMSAVKELNAMHGFLAPTKHEVDMRVNVNVHFD